MARFVTPEDFKNNDLSIGYNKHQEATLQNYINRVEPEVLKALLGSPLYTAFIADWDAAPAESFSEARFETIYNALCYEEGSKQYQSEGIKRMLMYFIYFEYIRDNNIQKRPVGLVENENENAEIASTSKAAIFTEYNSGIDTYKIIQLYINNNPESYDYEDYNGQFKEYASWI